MCRARFLRGKGGVTVNGAALAKMNYRVKIVCHSNISAKMVPMVFADTRYCGIIICDGSDIRVVAITDSTQ